MSNNNVLSVEDDAEDVENAGPINGMIAKLMVLRANALMLRI